MTSRIASTLSKSIKTTPFKSIFGRNFSTASTSPQMFCYQCEQTENTTGCKTKGVCGKTPEVAALQDLLMHHVKVTSAYLHRARLLGSPENPLINNAILKQTFSTLTNVNFSDSRFYEYLNQARELERDARAAYLIACSNKGVLPERHYQISILSHPKDEILAVDLETHNNTIPNPEILSQARTVGIMNRMETYGAAKDLVGLQELITYGLKGVCAYAEHAEMVGKIDDSIHADIQEVFSFLASEEAKSVENCVAKAMKVGEINLRVTKVLSENHTGKYGHPVPTQVRTTPVAGKCILVSGHDLTDLEMILKQTEGKGVNVFTHGEMLPASSYPGLKKYKHLVGHYGGAWQKQKSEFDDFPGAIVMTSNCIMQPMNSYKDRIFTTNVVGWDGVTHIGEKKDYSAVVKKALECDGFTEDDVPSDAKYLSIGFGHNAVLGVAGKVIENINSGALKRFFVIGGCDGSEGARNYFTDLAKEVPKDAAILTVGCGKYRINQMDYGTINGIPRLLDAGQCNDSYSLVVIASALADAYKTDVNKLPISFALSWLEQKAAAVLLTLLYLNIKNIRLGPNLPAFIPPAALNLLVEKFGLKPVGEPAVDIQNMMKGE